jgi:hypothetical protein
MDGDELKKNLLQLSADLDRLAETNDKGSSWESAGHLRNRSNGVIRRLARQAQSLGESIAPPSEPVLRVTETKSLAEVLNMGVERP